MNPLARPLILAAISLAAVVAPFSTHAKDILLCIDEIPGESQVLDPANCIEIQSWNWSGETASSGQVGSGRTRARAEVGPLVVFKEIDRSTPDLLIAVLQGKAFPEMTLIVRSCPAGCEKEPLPLVTITMENVVLVRFEVGSMAGTRPTDSFGFEFEKLEFCYQPFDAQGQPNREVCRDYDLEAGV